ncbi:MAG: hypothetical protein BGO15_00515 [Microbacterium sp. 71-23]|uniref:hypothetical protein n=1 Tax=Microbacterium TaxID=33882 RepID=UPI0009296DAE|nr:hypothetical protein [Microbacterium sp. 71-23]OJU75463.1 MAG: hypothetical protein BGO15_00515 [Microbacterium sp. 71-23]
MSTASVIRLLAVAFSVALTLRGMWIGAPVDDGWLLLGCMLGYLAVAWLCILWGWTAVITRSSQPETVSSSGDHLPIPLALLALAATVALPPLVAYGAGPHTTPGTHTTLYLGAIGALMATLTVRRRPWMAWTGIVVLAGWSISLLGPATALGLGLVGSTVWVGAAQFLVLALDRAALDTERLGEVQRVASAQSAAQGAQAHERRVQVNRVLLSAGDALARVIDRRGVLSDDERIEARVVEGRLRDELRGARLLDPEVRAALESVRRRGASVSLSDDGAIDDIGEEELGEIRAELADTLRSARSDRVYVRTSSDPRVAVTVVGRAARTIGLDEDDSVDLWREIERSPR